MMQTACLGEDYRDLCTDPDCPVCTLWQRPEESMEQWKTRIREAYRAAPFLTKESPMKRGAA